MISQIQESQRDLNVSEQYQCILHYSVRACVTRSTNFVLLTTYQLYAFSYCVTGELHPVINLDVSTGGLPVPVGITHCEKIITSNQRTKLRHNCILIPRATIGNKNSNLRSIKGSHPSFLLKNARSLLPKIDELTSLLSTNPVDLVAITESWLHNDVQDSLLHINGFNLFRNDIAMLLRV